MTEHTRQDYLNGKCTHREYYNQYVTDEIKEMVIFKFGTDKLYKSKDEHLNDISISQWDDLTQFMPPLKAKMEQLQDYPTLAGKVCILKEAARQIIEAKP